MLLSSEISIIEENHEVDDAEYSRIFVAFRSHFWAFTRKSVYMGGNGIDINKVIYNFIRLIITYTSRLVWWVGLLVHHKSENLYNISLV